MHLVERNSVPGGLQLVNTRQVGRHAANDIVELAREIQTADLAIRNTATGKLTLILEQVRQKKKHFTSGDDYINKNVKMKCRLNSYNRKHNAF